MSSTEGDVPPAIDGHYSSVGTRIAEIRGIQRIARYRRKELYNLILLKF
jgi:hypothetical protein